MIKVQFFFIISLILLAYLAPLSSADDDDSSSSSTPTPKSSSTPVSTKRTPKTSKPSTSPVSLATHPPWPTRSTEPTNYGSVSRATHPPWPTRGSTSYDPYADFYSSRATHAPYPPIQRATHAPYPPLKKGSSGDSASSSSSSTSSSSSSLASTIVKKQLLKIDADSLRNWLKEAFAYIAAPLFMPSAITKAIKAPPGLSSPGRSIWSKMIASFKSVILKKNDSEDGTGNSGSTEDRADQVKENVATFYRKLAEKMTSSSWSTLLSSKKAHKRNVRSVGRRTFRTI
ncbi:uncharacterized protein DDB_G0271670-like [Panonychus citri]|uniref:uncharacterized protein DDB_G0271670-like n=1 Tax=Panonychus citri TaxID=50023 RepID=UPI0023075FDC|nr:uncharacterized protein DDB_G0271670-like [Panonychus citri]